ncbi:uncharacterized protein LOC124114635 [Haliotis rufescens]|uniref:uncharacterized protein LOC124114635 n=1 Tax=Haliotis rufescens TaxID=6454 RepID=UPI001EB03CA8|nr:uncharacterized protein LOC124114635 [Haliotis rufescens]
MSDEDIFLTHAQKMDAFYYSPLLVKPKADRWFSNFPIGHNTLQGIIKRLCRNAGIEGKRTNHSLRATSATRLYRANVDGQLICEQTGHRSETVRTYKRTSEDQKLLVSDIIYGGGKQKKSVTATATRPSPDDATAPPSIATATAIPSSAAPPPAVSSEIVSDHDLREKTKKRRFAEYLCHIQLQLNCKRHGLWHLRINIETCVC